MDRRIAIVRGDECPGTVDKPKDFERLGLGIDQPHVADALARVNAQFWHAVDGLRRRGEDFAYPIRRDGDGRRVREYRQACSKPAAQIRNDDVSTQMKLGFVQNPPAAGPSPTLVKRPA